jgi:hypothetical protein
MATEITSIFLLPEIEITSDGSGDACDLGAMQGKLLLVTLGITRIIEQESLDVAILGSPDSQEWPAAPLLSFPQKFYCGTYQLLLDLTARPEARYVKVRWKANRWGRGEPKPLFRFYVGCQTA